MFDILDTIDLRLADCITEMQELPDNFFDSIVTDPPYGLEFMGKEWDCPNKGDVRQTFKGSIPDDKKTPFKRSKVRYGGSASYNSGIDAMRSFQDWMTVWAEQALRVAKPGAYMTVFGGSRTQAWMTVGIAEAGWECRDTCMYIYGSGFPKSVNVGLAIDKYFGADREVVGKRIHPTLKNVPNVKSRAYHAETLDSDQAAESWDITGPATEQAKQWDGWGSNLKPCYEAIAIFRKPLEGTIAQNVLLHGTGAINIEACRVPIDPEADASQLRTMKRSQRTEDQNGQVWGMSKNSGDVPQVVRPEGRFPGNLLHDGSPEVIECFPDAEGQLARARTDGEDQNNSVYGSLKHVTKNPDPRLEIEKSASRFFYCAKASRSERGVGNGHPTVKPIALMSWLCKLVTQPGGIILDPFLGSGTTGIAAIRNGFQFLGIENDPLSYFTAKARVHREIDEDLLR